MTAERVTKMSNPHGKRKNSAVCTAAGTRNPGLVADHVARQKAWRGGRRQLTAWEKKQWTDKGLKPPKYSRNPQEGAAYKARIAKLRRNMSPKQIRIFGTPRQKEALKQKRRAAIAKSNPGHKHRSAATTKIYRTSSTKRNTRKKPAKNPTAHLLTFGLAGANPKSKRRTTKPMPAAKKKSRGKAKAHKSSANVKKYHKKSKSSHPKRTMMASNPKRYTKKSKNGTRVIVKNTRHHKNHYFGRSSRNPSLFGQSNAFEMSKMVVGGLAGVTITKSALTMLPSNLTSSPLMRVVSSVGTAWLAGWLAGKFLDRTIGDALFFGGLMQAGSVALNSFFPSVGATIGLQGLGGGMGDLIAGSYPVPQNPLFPQYNPGYGAMAALPAAPAAKVASSAPMATGVSGIFGNAF